MDNLLFWGGLIGVFYYLWDKNLPAGKLPSKVSESAPVSGVKRPKKAPKEQERTPEPSLEPGTPLPAYDPASNPFRATESPEEPVKAHPDGFRGSYDDLMDNEPSVEDTKGEEEGVEGEGEEGEDGMDGESDPEDNGQTTEGI